MGKLRRFTTEFKQGVIGYHLSRHIDTKLTLSALQMAIQDREPAPGFISHSDQEVQESFLIMSMSRKNMIFKSI